MNKFEVNNKNDFKNEYINGGKLSDYKTFLALKLFQKKPNDLDMNPKDFFIHSFKNNFDNLLILSKKIEVLNDIIAPALEKENISFKNYCKNNPDIIKNVWRKINEIDLELSDEMIFDLEVDPIRDEFLRSVGIDTKLDAALKKEEKVFDSSINGIDWENVVVDGLKRKDGRFGNSPVSSREFEGEDFSNGNASDIFRPDRIKDEIQESMIEYDFNKASEIINSDKKNKVSKSNYSRNKSYRPN